MPKLTDEEQDALFLKARQVAADFIGYPYDEEDKDTIANATPMQAINALEKRLKELLDELHAQTTN